MRTRMRTRAARPGRSDIRTKKRRICVFSQRNCPRPRSATRAPCSRWATSARTRPCAPGPERAGDSRRSRRSRANSRRCIPKRRRGGWIPTREKTRARTRARSSSRCGEPSRTRVTRVTERRGDRPRRCVRRWGWSARTTRRFAKGKPTIRSARRATPRRESSRSRDEKKRQNDKTTTTWVVMRDELLELLGGAYT